MDVLGLARVRDRLLNRLLVEGLNKERDVAYFLRTAGSHDAERMRIVRERALQLHRAAQKWHDRSEVALNKPYVDLMFAFALAKLGDHTHARELINKAREGLPGKSEEDDQKDVAAFLFKAFAFRVEQAIQGAHGGPLSKELLSELEVIDRRYQGPSGTSTPRYAIDRLREQSWILEPVYRFDPYARSKRMQDEVLLEVADLPNEADPAKLAERIRKLFRMKLSAEDRLVALTDAMPQAPRAGLDLAVWLLNLVPGVIDASEKPAPNLSPEIRSELEKKRSQLLERSLFVAGHFDRSELVQVLFNRMLDYLKAQTGDARAEAINQVAHECLRSLRKLGLKDEIDRFLHQVTEFVVGGQSLALLRSRSDKSWPVVLRALVHLAEGWLFFGHHEQARPFLEEARLLLFGGSKERVSPIPFTRLAQAYVSALGQGPVDEALMRIEEMFLKLDKLPNSFTTAGWYSRLHLNVIEDVIRALVSDNFAAKENARRWMDDDEFLVRPTDSQGNEGTSEWGVGSGEWGVKHGRYRRRCRRNSRYACKAIERHSSYSSASWIIKDRRSPNGLPLSLGRIRNRQSRINTVALTLSAFAIFLIILLDKGVSSVSYRWSVDLLTPIRAATMSRVSSFCSRYSRMTDPAPLKKTSSSILFMASRLPSRLPILSTISLSPQLVARIHRNA